MHSKQKAFKCFRAYPIFFAKKYFRLIFILVATLSSSLVFAQNHKATAESLDEGTRFTLEHLACAPTFVWDTLAAIKKENLCGKEPVELESDIEKHFSDHAFGLAACNTVNQSNLMQTTLCLSSKSVLPAYALRYSIDANAKVRVEAQALKPSDQCGHLGSNKWFPICTNAQVGELSKVLDFVRAVSPLQLKARNFPKPAPHPWEKMFEKQLSERISSDLPKEFTDASQELSRIDPHSAEPLKLLPIVQHVDELFKPNYCAVENGQVKVNKKLGGGLFNKAIDSCELLMRLYQIACYKSYLGADAKNQIQLCAKLEDLSGILNKNIPKNSIYEHNMLQGRFLKLEATARKLLTENISDSEKITRLEKLTTAWPDIDSLKFASLKYDAWILYSKVLLARAALEPDTKVKRSLYERAEHALEKASAFKEFDKSFKYFAFSHGQDTGLGLIAVRNLLNDVGRATGVKNLNPQNELGTEIEKHEVKELENFNLEIRELTSPAFNENANAENNSAAFVPAKSRFSGSENNSDETASLISKIEALAKLAVQKAKLEINPHSPDIETWRLSQKATGSIDFIEQHLLPVLPNLGLEKLQAIHAFLSAPPEAPFALLQTIYPKTKILSLNSVSASAFANLNIISQLMNDGVITHEEAKALLLNWVFKKLGRTFPESNFFTTDADALLKQIFRYPLPASYVLANRSESDTLDSVYKKWLLSNIQNFENESLKVLGKDKDLYPQAELNELSKLAAVVDPMRSKWTLSQAEALQPQPQEPLTQHLERQVAIIGGDKIQWPTEKDPLGHLAHINLEKSTMHLATKSYLPQVEQRVLLPALKTRLDDSVKAKLQETLHELNYDKLPLNYLFDHLGEGGTSLEKTTRNYFEEKYEKALSSLLDRSKKAPFEEKQKIRILEVLNKNFIKAALSTYDLGRLEKLVTMVEAGSLDLGQILKITDANRKWQDYTPSTSPAQNLVWNKVLSQTKRIDEAEHKHRVEGLLTNRLSPYFEDEGFNTFFKDELTDLGYGEIELNFIQDKLTDKAANLDKLLKEYLALKEDKPYKFTLPGFGKFAGSGGTGKGFSSSGYLYPNTTIVHRFATQRFLKGDGKYSVEASRFLDAEPYLTDSNSVGSSAFSISPPTEGILANKYLIPSEGNLAIIANDRQKRQAVAGIDPGFLNRKTAYTAYDFQNDQVDKNIHKEIDRGKVDFDEYRKYYLSGEGNIDLDSETLAFIEKIKSFYEEHKKAYGAYWSGRTQPGNEDRLKTVKEIETRWKEYLVQAVQDNEWISDLDPYFKDRMFDEKLKKSTFAYRSDLLLSESIENWIKLRFTYSDGQGTPLRPISASTVEKTKDWGDKLQQIASDQAGNCDGTNALYGHIMRKYFSVPTRKVVGFAGEGHTNENHRYSEQFPENYKVVDPRQDGHAWSEVLLGNSWVTVDATPFGEQKEKGLERESGRGGTEITRKRLEKSEAVQKLIQSYCKDEANSGILENKIDDFIKAITALNLKESEYQSILKSWAPSRLSPACSFEVIFSLMVPANTTVAGEAENKFKPISKASFLSQEDVKSKTFSISPKLHEKILQVFLQNRLWLVSGPRSSSLWPGRADGRSDDTGLEPRSIWSNELDVFLQKGHALPKVVLDSTSENMFQRLPGIICTDDDASGPFQNGLTQNPLLFSYYLKKYGRKGFFEKLSFVCVQHTLKNLDASVAPDFVSTFEAELATYLREDNELDKIDIIQIIANSKNEASKRLLNIFYDHILAKKTVLKGTPLDVLLRLLGLRALHWSRTT